MEPTPSICGTLLSSTIVLLVVLVLIVCMLLNLAAVVIVLLEIRASLTWLTQIPCAAPPSITLPSMTISYADVERFRLRRVSRPIQR